MTEKCNDITRRMNTCDQLYNGWCAFGATNVIKWDMFVTYLELYGSVTVFQIKNVHSKVVIDCF